jgi:hypothetical protein
MAIIVSRQGKSAVKVQRNSELRESDLQQYIADNPDAIPLYDISEDIRLCVLVREFPTGTGSIDALGVDKTGEIYLIETKLYRNTDKRHVVAQVLDYGASLWSSYRDPADFIDQVNARCLEKRKQTLRQILEKFFELDDDGFAQLLNGMRENIRNASFRFVVLMDTLHKELKDLVTFLNENSRFSFYAVELEFYKHEQYEIVIPKLFGAETGRQRGTTGPRGTWDELTFFAAAEQSTKPEHFRAIKRLYDFSKELTPSITWGTGGRSGSFNVKVERISAKSIYSVDSRGGLSINFEWIPDPHKERLKKLLESNVSLPIKANYQDKRPGFKPELWCDKIENLEMAIREFLDLSESRLTTGKRSSH